MKGGSIQRMIVNFKIGDLIMMPIRKYNDLNWFPSLFNDFFDNDWMPKMNTSTPAFNVIEDENEYKVEIAAPGMTKEDCHISLINDDQLSISFEKKSESAEESTDKKKYLRREFSYSQFQQTFTLPENVDKEQITASVVNGVLTIDLHKKVLEAAKANEPRMIEIK